MEQVPRLGFFSRLGEEAPLIFASCVGGRLSSFHWERVSFSPTVGQIECAKVVKLLPSVKACFLQLSRGQMGALFLEEKEPLPSLGEKVLVQVKKEAYGQKHCRVSTQIDLRGRFLVWSPRGPTVLGVSHQIKGEKGRELRDFFERLRKKEEGLILRSVAASVPQEAIVKELEKMRQLWKKIQRSWKSSSSVRVLYHPPDFLLDRIQNELKEPYAHLLVDDLKVFRLLQKELAEDPFGLDQKLRFVPEDTPLFFSRGLDCELFQSLAPEQSLPSGGQIKIEETEAFISVDVNSARYKGSTSPEETAFLINCEAVDELVHQIKFRDLAGTLVIDFIDLQKPEHEEQVLKKLKDALKEDPRVSHLSEFSKLGVVQISRERKESSLVQQFFENCPACKGSGRRTHASWIHMREREMLRDQEKKLSKKFLSSLKPSESSFSDHFGLPFYS